MPPNRSYLLRSIVRLAVLLAVLAVAVGAMFNRQFIVDQLTVWQFKPSSEIVAIASRAQLTDKGKFYFYASRPTVDARSAFNTHCKQLVEKTAILGCYANRQIHVFDVADARLDGIREVTAAHEMLHAAYDRLSATERVRVDRLIEEQSRGIADQKLKDRLALYDQTEPGERLNELHSILGTEITSLSDELEDYYSRYFADRGRLVALSNQYETVFQQLEDQQKNLVAELNELADHVDAASKNYESTLDVLQRDITAFNRRADAGEFVSQSAFNAERAGLLARQSALQRQRTEINDMIARYNQKKSELDALNTTAEGLQRSIDSKLPEAPSL